MEDKLGGGPIKMDMNASDDWTFVEDAKEVHNELLTSICMDMSTSQRTVKAEDFIVFQDVSLLPLVDITEDDTSATPGTLVITKYELVFADEKETEESQKNHLLPHECDPSKVPLHTIAKIEPNKQFPNMLEIWCKDLRTLRFRFESVNSAIAFSQALHNHPCWRGDYFAFHNKEVFPDTVNGWEIFDWEREFFMRQKVPKKYWRLVTRMNHQYEHCRSYPSQFIVPASLKDGTLKKAAKFRSHNRLPVLCWYNSRNKASMTRCSQPMVGLMQMRSAADEAVIKAISDANPSSKIMYIIDCRAWVNAYANTARGAGTEKMNYYPNCRLHFMNIDNIHTMRDSFKQIAEVCRKKVDYRWFCSLDAQRWLLEGKGWLEHASLVLKAAVSIAEFLEKGSSVLVHCSDGWDRTSQLCALAQIILDPYYRTIEGFEVLIEKEWLAFGHKFSCRCGHGNQGFFDTSECSPIFLQFIDCVYQLHHQFENMFEFNEQFLITLMDHVYSCKYGTFLYNSEKLRHQHDVRHKTLSLWTYMNYNKKYFVNPFYQAYEGVLPKVCTNKEEFAFWGNYYLRFHMNAKSPLQQYLNRNRQIKDENDRLGLQVEELKEKLEREAAARCQAEEELSRLTKEKKDLETAMQGVQCTVYRTEGGERPYLVAKILSPNKDLVSGFCDDLRNLKIIEDYYCALAQNAEEENGEGGNTGENNRAAALVKKERRLTAGIGDEGWTNLFVDGVPADNSEGGAGTTQNGNNNKLHGKYVGRGRKRSGPLHYEDDDERKAPRENGGVNGDNSQNPDCESDDDEPPEGQGGAVHTNGNSKAKKDNSNGSDTGNGNARDTDADDYLIDCTRMEMEGDKSACAAAYALAEGNEVVTLELSSETGSWRLPVRFADYLGILRHYLADYGIRPIFKWPYATN